MKFMQEHFSLDGKVSEGVGWIAMHTAVILAQKAFDEWLEKQPTYYGDTWGNYSLDITNDTSKKGKLVCIQEIEKKECEHVGFSYIDGLNRLRWSCNLCDADLTPTGWWVE